jgi:hypothetical protein
MERLAVTSAPFNDALASVGPVEHERVDSTGLLQNLRSNTVKVLRKAGDHK